MTPVSLTARNFTFTHRLINGTLEGITHEESLFQPPNGGNSINWILGHIAFYRDVMLEKLGEKCVWTDTETTACYERGSKLLSESGKSVELSKLLEIYNNSQPILLAAIDRLGNSPTEDGKLEESIAFSNFHEAYHLGQISMLRRTLGKESIIK